MDYSSEQDDGIIFAMIDRSILEASEEHELTLKDRLALRRELFNSIRRLDVITELLEEKGITEIMVNGYNKIFVEKNGSIYRTDKSFESPERLQTVIQQIVAACNRRINQGSPIVDARLEDGSRVNIVTSPISMEGDIVTIRRFSESTMDMEELVRLGTLPQSIAKLLRLLVISKYNIFIAGGTSSGKTTFLNALSDFIPRDERVITIEDIAELRLPELDNIVRLEARNANVEGENAITIRDLIKTSLRMRPDRIIVGEVRDQAVIDMITAMNTGHDGSICTGHANSCSDALLRLETMYLMGLEIPVDAIRRQLASAIDIIVHLGRLRDKSRKVLSISEVRGMEKGEICINTLFEYVETGEECGRVKGMLRKVNDMINISKLSARGMLALYEEACSGL
ncbi:MAG: CpaF family protein [Wujia sp.]